ncbi:MAG: ATP-binding protein [Desulfuromonadia bacterium]
MAQQTLERKIIILIFGLLCGTVVTFSAIHLTGFADDYRRSLVTQAVNALRGIQGDVGKVLSLGIELTDMQGLSGKCTETLDHSPFLSHCFITDPAGRVIAHDDRSRGDLQYDINAADGVSINGYRLYRVSSPTLGPVYDLLLPLTAPDGKIAGYVHAGFSLDLITAKVLTIAGYMAVVLVAALFFSIVLSLRFVRRMISAPISRLLEGVKRVARGEYGEPLPVVSGTYDFDELARNVNLMSRALHERERELQKSYEELAATHQKLQVSYLQLEGLSLEVEQSSELYRSLMQESVDAIIVFDDQGIIKMANRMAEEIFALPADGLRGLPLEDFLAKVPFENREEISLLFSHAEPGRRLSAEARIAPGGTGRRTVRVTVSSITSGDQTVVQAIFHDLTREYEAMENLRKSAEDLARVNKMKDSFLGMASHELKTPLTVILGYTELILSEMADSVDEQTREMIRNISNAAHRLDGIVRDMVDVSLMSGGKLGIKEDPVDLNALIESTLSEMHYFFTMRKQQVTTILEPGLPEIVGDPMRLSQLLTNVIGNAVKFTPDGGKITIVTLSKYLDRTPPPVEGRSFFPFERQRQLDLYVEIIVQDTGIGIDKKDQPLIFDKFYEVGEIAEHSSGKSAFKAKGTGLGLSIAKGIVELHGGEIWVESPGYDPVVFPGSVFHILLPVNRSRFHDQERSQGG